ncbi:MAG: glycoside hydrolase family 127 protein, partial [Candidatus Saccharicenans sp.]|nr:glycoside hydrolase family 127 protein [Candidatus Saccharicenans sp.]
MSGLITRKKVLVISCLLLAAWVFSACSTEKKDYSIKAVNLTAVRFSDGFWSSRIETNGKVTIPHSFRQSEETGRIKNFEIAGGLAEGDFCSRYPFDDSDIYKLIEGASYRMMLQPDPELDKYLDGLIAKIAAAQEKDGYIYTARSIKNKGGKIPLKEWVTDKRWEKEQD